MRIYYEVWNLLQKIDDKEQLQDGIKAIKKEIYKACKFRVAKSWYNQIVQELPPEGARFTINKEYIT